VPWNSKKSNSYRWGILAEYIAAIFFLLRGYQIKKIRYKTKVGEVDLIVQKKRDLVFVEVKFRKEISAALEAVSPQSVLRIRRAAEHYLFCQQKESSMIHDNIRFDVIAINSIFSVRHIKNAF
jgi:putative endonuclease